MHHQLDQMGADDLPDAQSDWDAHGRLRLGLCQYDAMVISGKQLGSLCCWSLIEAELHTHIAGTTRTTEGHGVNVALEVLQKSADGYILQLSAGKLAILHATKLHACQICHQGHTGVSPSRGTNTQQGSSSCSQGI